MEHNLTTVQAYLESVALSRRANAARTYQTALKSFTQALLDANSDPHKTSIEEMTEDAVTWFAACLKEFIPYNYLTAANGLYEFLAAERLTEPNLPR